jgi:hypothetical protein
MFQSEPVTLHDFAGGDAETVFLDSPIRQKQRSRDCSQEAPIRYRDSKKSPLLLNRSQEMRHQWPLYRPPRPTYIYSDPVILTRLQHLLEKTAEKLPTLSSWTPQEVNSKKWDVGENCVGVRRKLLVEEQVADEAIVVAPVA